MQNVSNDDGMELQNKTDCLWNQPNNIKQPLHPLSPYHSMFEGVEGDMQPKDTQYSRFRKFDVINLDGERINYCPNNRPCSLTHFLTSGHKLTWGACKSLIRFNWFLSKITHTYIYIFHRDVSFGE